MSCPPPRPVLSQVTCLIYKRPAKIIYGLQITVALISINLWYNLNNVKCTFISQDRFTDGYSHEVIVLYPLVTS